MRAATLDPRRDPLVLDPRVEIYLVITFTPLVAA